jgi:hypothetical protein
LLNSHRRLVKIASKAVLACSGVIGVAILRQITSHTLTYFHVYDAESVCMLKQQGGYSNRGSR